MCMNIILLVIGGCVFVYFSASFASAEIALPLDLPTATVYTDILFRQFSL